MAKRALLIIAAVGLAVPVWAGSPTSRPRLKPTSQPDVRMRTPEQERAEIEVPEGYRLDLVTSEPEVISPALCVWDGNGRMYVAEMRSYMLDIDGRKAHSPISRVSRFEDADGDGVYEKRTTFVDKMMLPRMILPLDERVLIRETDTKDIYCYTDTDNDGVADKKERVYEGGRQEGNLEHQPSDLMWNLDNWIYVTHQTERFRFTRGKMEKESYVVNAGQWGLAMDDTGRIILSTAGSENPAHHFQVMPQYGDVNLPGQLADGFMEVFPLLRMTDVQGGPPRLKPSPEGGLNRFTSCSGPSIFRGDALPGDLYGQYILPEPVGRLVRRATLTNQDGKWMIASATPKGEEFINSTDPNFRPVWSATGPDGALYLCDMYHGIIQEANWTKEGSYLRPEILKYGLEKNINAGRIWRLAHDGYRLRKPPRMLEETPAQLVGHLSDPNGWWRDTAQKLIILRGDRSVLPALRAMAMGDSNPLARLHALWTVEGLDAVDAELVLTKLKDHDPRLRAAAVRVAEPLIKKKVARVARAVRELAFDDDPEVAKQVMLSMMYLKDETSAEFVVNRMLHGSPRRGEEKTKTLATIHHDLRADIEKARIQAEERKVMGLSDPKLVAVFDQGKTYYQQMCISCHGTGGAGANTPDGKSKLAPPLKGSQRLMAQPDLVATIVLSGITGPHDGGATYPEQMPSFPWADDARLAAVLTYARNEWGNKATPITLDDVARNRPAAAARNKPFTLSELPAAVVEHRSKQVLLTAAMATTKGNGLVSVGDSIGLGLNRDVAMTWKATIPENAVYQIKLLCESFGPGEFVLKIGDKSYVKTIPAAGVGEVDAGAAHLFGTATIEFAPAAAADRPWAPVNVKGLLLEQLE